MNYKLLLTTSGIGSRLGELTDFTNKALVRVGDKPAISHIIDSYPEHIEIVVTLGYYGSHVSDFLKLAYPERKFTFVNITNFKGKGSSLGLSMLGAAEHLQCPFIFNACDTIVKEDIPHPEANWVAGHSKTDNSQYRTIEKQGSKLIKFKEKGESMHTDLSYIGLCGIKDYLHFWNELETLLLTSSSSTISDCHVINRMSGIYGIDFEVLECDSWLDIGNTSELNISRKKVCSDLQVLDKPDENIYLIKDSIIKFFHNTEVSEKRARRANKLKGLVPEITGHKNNFYKYKKVDGDLFARTVNEDKLRSFLEWCSSDLWKPKAETSREEFKEACSKFYFKKTEERIDKLKKATGIKDEQEVINNKECRSVKDIILNLDEYHLTDGISCKFHGDCILDNVIEKDGKFSLIDWRQDFAGLDVGDVYYDLAKLNHNLTFNHDLVSKGHYKVEFKPDGVEVDILRSDKLVRCKKIFYDFLTEYDYDSKKVDILTSLIWINMSPLHEGELKPFLFYFGKFYLNEHIS